jgi:hypothetical protein
MTRRPVLCDRCGEPIARLADGWAQWRRDERGVVTALALVHHSDRCMYNRDGETEADRIEDHHAAAFLNARHIAYLKSLPRYLEGTSVSRLVAKVQRLAKLQPAPDRRAGTPA